MSKRLFIVVLVLLGALASNAFAAAWTDLAPADHLWSTPGNWTDNEVPHMATNANIRSMGGAYPIIQAGISASAYALFIQGTSSTDVPTLTMNGGTLAVGIAGGESLSIGHEDNLYGQMDLHDGIFSVAGVGFLGTRGFGTLNIHGGMMAIDYFKVGNSTASALNQGYMNLYGGVLNAGGLELRGDSVTNITNGRIVVAGNYVGNVDNWVSLGRLVAYGGAGTIQRSYDGTVTTITAIPEPVTIALLGLGGLFIRRRRN